MIILQHVSKSEENIKSILQNGFNESTYFGKKTGVFFQPFFKLSSDSLYILIDESEAEWIRLELWDSYCYYDSYFGARPLRILTLFDYNKLKLINKNYIYNKYETIFTKDWLKNRKLLTSDEIYINK